ncbi:hypothetical protein ACQP2T_48105 [Nonomuraea sp. CA-143628]|uniref:hypothetical protein n=1 Tax=Nonomuraea sp. CA-143628 TaxID=3239997 RepID=UPI003D91EA42
MSSGGGNTTPRHRRASLPPGVDPKTPSTVAPQHVEDFQHRAGEVLSDENARLLAAQLQESWGGRWQVMWEPWGRKFRAFPAYDMAVNTSVVGGSLPELWRNVLNVDQKLVLAVAEAIPLHPPTALHIPPGFFQEMAG